MGVNLSQRDIDDLVARGAVLGPPVQLPTQAVETEPEGKVEFLEPTCFTNGKTLFVYAAFESKSESNLRSWKARSRRSGAAWKAVREAMGAGLAYLDPFTKAYASGKALRATFTRLGGRKMDRSNLPAAMKGCEDAIAYLLGASDGDSRWHPDWQQDQGSEVGVKITIEVFA